MNDHVTAMGRAVFEDDAGPRHGARYEVIIERVVFDLDAGIRDLALFSLSLPAIVMAAVALWTMLP